MRLSRGVPMLAALFATALVSCATAQADPSSGSETIDMTAAAPTLPSHAPYRAAFTGAYTAAGSLTPAGDAGSIQGVATFTAVPSPSVGVLHFDALLTSATGQGTLLLRCDQTQRANSVLSDGTCTVLDGTGVYASLRGSGKVTDVETTLPDGTPVLNDVLTLPAH